eukprot:SAG31_NODE_940_length_10870_cov_12.600501_4_plen_104_part_00
MQRTGYILIFLKKKQFKTWASFRSAMHCTAVCEHAEPMNSNTAIMPHFKTYTSVPKFRYTVSAQASQCMAMADGLRGSRGFASATDLNEQDTVSGLQEDCSGF